MPDSSEFSITRASQLTVPNKDWTHYRSGLKLRCSSNSSGVTLVIVSQGKPITSNIKDTSHITESNVKFLTKEPIVGLKISDGDTLKKRLQITFESAGHFNLFASKIRLWLGLSVTSSHSLDYSASQDVSSQSQSQRQIKAGEGDVVESQTEFKIPLSQPKSQLSQPFTLKREHSQVVLPEHCSQGSTAARQPSVAFEPDHSQANVSQALSEAIPSRESRAPETWNFDKQQPSTHSKAVPDVHETIQALLSAAESLRSKIGEASPKFYSQEPFTLSQPAPSVTSAFRPPFDVPYQSNHTQMSYNVGRPDYSFNHTNASLNQPSLKRPRFDDSYVSQSTQRLDNSCFIPHNTTTSASQFMENETLHTKSVPSITETDLKKAMEDTAFEPTITSTILNGSHKGKSKMDGLFTKVLDEAMKNEHSLDELDDNALRFEIASKLKSKSFLAFAKRVDSLIRGNNERDH